MVAATGAAEMELHECTIAGTVTDVGLFRPLVGVAVEGEATLVCEDSLIFDASHHGLQVGGAASARVLRSRICGCARAALRTAKDADILVADCTIRCPRPPRPRPRRGRS